MLALRCKDRFLDLLFACLSQEARVRIGNSEMKEEAQRSEVKPGTLFALNCGQNLRVPWELREVVALEYGATSELH
jgi:hypothetical protein